ncbi:ABC transporter ATP-binding protein, partial [Lacticaseibacillus paracasei]
WYQYRFSNDIPLLMASIQQSVITLNKVAATQKQQFLATGTAMQKKLTLDTTVSVKVNQRLGNNYLNALLFARYRSQLWKKLR